MRFLILLLALTTGLSLRAQGFPWERPLLITWSSDGTFFDPPTLFQDSSGVPSVIRWKGDTLIATFQWFRQPNPSPTWDRVAVKFSYDNGATWNSPTPIIVDGMPPNYQRPFDPTLAMFAGDSLRIYFSSSDGMPLQLDSTVNTYSAVSVDGIHYTFEPGARVDVLDDRVIDPAVIHFGPGWHYLAPAGAPQDGVHHYLGPDGVDFSPVPMIPSDNMHNWTGNYMVDSPSELRFYGAGPNGIWHNSSPNGGQWNGYVSTNIQGGDPSALKITDGSYLMVFVGAEYNVGTEELKAAGTAVFPVPASGSLHLESARPITRYRILSVTGNVLQEGVPVHGTIPMDGIAPGAHLLELMERDGRREVIRIVNQ